MKFTAIILISACVTASATGFSQITLAEKNVPLQKIFKELQRQSGYDFLFSSTLLEKAGNASVTVKNVSLKEAVEEVLKGKNLTYEILEKTVIIKPKIESPKEDASTELSVTKEVAGIDVSGKVLDEEGNPLKGATVKVKGGTQGTTTDDNGVFVLKAVDGNATLEISFVGYEKTTININNRTTVTVALKQVVASLNEVIINKGYYSEQQKFTLGNVGKVTSKQIERQPVQNPLLALQGRVSGLFITQASGLSGSGITVRIQGQNSINYGNDPLYVIDGVPVVSQLLSTTTGGVGNILGSSSDQNSTPGNGSPLSSLNPADIESIEVLKDADATAIYGSRAANGAILITTKKGKSGKMKTDFNIQQGFGHITKMAKLMNTSQYLEMRKEAKANDGLSISSTDYDINGLWDTTRYTNWQKVLIGRTAQYFNAGINLSGGSDVTQYLIGGSFHRETTVYPGDFSDKKGNIHFSLNSGSANQKFKFQFTGNYAIDFNKVPRSDFTGFALILPPDAPALYNSDGTLNWQPTATGTSSWTNPLSLAAVQCEIKTKNIITNAMFNYEILKGLNIKSSFGYSNLQINEFSAQPLVSYKPERRLTSTRLAYYTNSTINTLNIDPQINYKTVVGNSKFETLIGASYFQNNSDGINLSGRGYNSDDVLKDIRSATTILPISTVNYLYKYCEVYGRLNYILKDQYIINLTANRDGSSRFGPLSQFNSFWSAAAGWIFSKSKLFDQKSGFLSFGKIKASYGTTGSDQIGNYRYMNLYNPVGVGVPYQGATGLAPVELANPYLQWEETKKIQTGLELGFFKDRIFIKGNYISNKSSNQLLEYILPIITGNNLIATNFPATVKNTAWEFELASTNVTSTDFKWSTAFNITIQKNKLVSFPGLANSSYADLLVIGQPLTIFKRYHFLGVDPTSGVYQVAAADGTPTSLPDFSKDRTQLINVLPKFYGGIENSFSYRGIQLIAFFQFVNKISGSSFYYSNNVPPGTSVSNQPESALNRWRKPGDNAPIQRYNSDFSYVYGSDNLGYSDAVFKNGSYIRLKNLSLSWDLPKRILQQVHFQNISVYALGQNLITITKYPGLDPETQSSLPPLKMITFGIRAQF